MQPRGPKLARIFRFPKARNFRLSFSGRPKRRFGAREAIFVVFTLLALAMPLCGEGKSASPLVLAGLGRATMPLDSTWQFRSGDNPAWASASLDDSQWEPIEVGRPWEGQGHRDYTGFAWYRRHLVLPPGQPQDWNLAILVPRVDSACEVYWNGVLVGSVGMVPPHPVWCFEFADVPTKMTLGPAQSGVLAIRVWKAPIVFLSYPDEGGLTAVPQAGSVEAIAGLEVADRYKSFQQRQFFLAVVLLTGILGLLNLLMWLRNRNQMVLLWLALAMFFPLEEFLLDLPGLVSFRTFYALIGPAIGINDMALWFLLLALLGLNANKRLVHWTAILAATEISLDLVDCIFETFNWSLARPHLFLIADIATTIPAVLLELWGLVIVLLALRQRLDAARWLLAISALLADLYQAVDDMTNLGARWRHGTVHRQLDAPLFAIAGSPISLHTISNTFFLISILYAAWRYSAEQSQRKSAMEQEYRSVQELQQVLIPESLPELRGYAVTSAYRPAQEVGGDFFQLMALPGDRALLVLGDVSGKGLHAAMAVALIVGAIRSTVETTDDPGAVLAALNRRLDGRLRDGFATCLVLRLDSEGTCLIANAGHLPPYLNGRELALHPALPLGLMPDADYEPTKIALANGDRLTLYTDGLPEARNAAGELFGFTRVAEVLAALSDAHQIAEAAQQFGQEDDITVLTFTFAAGV